MDDPTRAVPAHVDKRELVDLEGDRRSGVRLARNLGVACPVSELEKVTGVLAVTAVDVCRRTPSEMRSTASVNSTESLLCHGRTGP